MLIIRDKNSKDDDVDTDEEFIYRAKRRCIRDVLEVMNNPGDGVSTNSSSQRVNSTRGESN